jgi:hypothetical protein
MESGFVAMDKRAPRRILTRGSVERRAEMVPGLIERERLAADLRRAEWLAETAPGPARANTLIVFSAVASTPRPERRRPLWQSVSALARNVWNGLVNQALHVERPIADGVVSRPR